MEPSAAQVREALQRLRQTSRHFERSAKGLTDAQLRHHPEAGSWSVHELLAHLRGAADVQGGWIARILAEDTPTIRYASARTGMRKTGYADLEFEPFLQAFSRQRAGLVKTLSSLDPAGWSRHAAFTGTRPGWTKTVFDIASGIGGHEQSHFDQITAAADVHHG